FWTYLGLFLWPSNLLPVYPTWSLAHFGLPDFFAVVGLVIVAAAAGAGRARIPRSVVVGAALFVTNIALVVGIVWNSYSDYAFFADRYLYLPGVGLAIVAVAALYALARTAGLSRRVPTGALALWCAVLGVATWRQVPVWRDSESLWTYTLARY